MMQLTGLIAFALFITFLRLLHIEAAHMETSVY